MTPDTLFLCLLGGYVAWRLYTRWQAQRLVPRYLAEGAQVIDVRGEGEFLAGHAPGSRNVPLHELAARVGEIDPARPVIVCCASGTRSAMARRRLRKLGHARVLNAGSWRNLR